MSASIIDGKAAAAALRARISDQVAEFRSQSGRTPGLAVVLVGADPASCVYVKAKSKATEEVGMLSIEHHLPEQARETELLDLIDTLNNDPLVDGILVQLPLPAHIDTQRIIEAISPDKDVDGFHVTNAGKLSVGRPSLVPCTPAGCITLLKSFRADLSGLHAVVVGRSNIVGKPVAQLLLQENCTVTIAHSQTHNLPEVVAAADIVIAAVGRPEMIRGHWLKPGTIVIDVGINRTVDGHGAQRLVGDVNFSEARQVAGAITPVPGGVGPMTIATLLSNTLQAAQLRKH